MRGTLRLAGYLLVALLLVGLLIASPGVWATSAQTHLNQTIPTPTPKGTQPTEQPPSPTEVSPTAEPGQGTATPEPTGSATAVTSTLKLSLEVSRGLVWPGVTLQYTATVANPGQVDAQQLVLTIRLPDGLVPGPLHAGSPATWNGQTLQARLATLAAGDEIAVPFGASVSADAPAGGVLVTLATVTAADGGQAGAHIAVAMPPAELPPTGSSGGSSPCPAREAGR